jgi:hypothetical protein
MFGFGALLDAGLLMFYQWRCFGNPLTPGHKFAESVVFSSWHKQGFYGLGEPSWQVFRDMSFSRTFGFFGTSPFMWLGLLAIPFALFTGLGPPSARRRRRLATAVWLLMMLTLWLAMSAAVNWRGGWTVGPRFFGAAPPFFAFGAVCALEWLACHGRLWRALARGLAGGLAVASVCTLGIVSMVYNSVPEDVTRPLTQLALPLARAGFVPHHAAELFGWMSPAFWYVAAGCAIAASLVAALWPSKDRLWTMIVRIVVVAGAFVVGMMPAFSKPTPEEGGDGTSALRGFAMTWEPSGRDFIAKAREQAERFGPRRPCSWYRVADYERAVGWNGDADRDEKRATAPRNQCR